MALPPYKTHEILVQRKFEQRCPLVLLEPAITHGLVSRLRFACLHETFRSAGEMLNSLGMQQGGSQYRRLLPAFHWVFGATIFRNRHATRKGDGDAAWPVQLHGRGPDLIFPPNDLLRRGFEIDHSESRWCSVLR